MARETAKVREGQYNSPGMILVIAKDDQGTTVTATDGKGSEYRWHFGKDGVFSHISAGVGSGEVG